MLHLNPSLAYYLKICTILENRPMMAGVKVDCSSRHLAFVPDGIPRGVTWLKILDNKITQIYKNDFRYLSNLTELDLSVNVIAYLEDRPFIDLVELRQLDMSQNQLTQLSNHLFEGLWKLTMLDLRDNWIRVISPSAFGSMPSLRRVQLENNLLIQITDIQSIFKLPHIDYISLNDNLFSSETKYLPLNISSSVRVLVLSSDILRIFSITTPVFPHLERIVMNSMECRDPVSLPKFGFFRNVTHLSLYEKCITFKGMTNVLESLVSLVHLHFLYTGKHINRGLLETACSIPSLRSLTIDDFSVDHRLASCSQLTMLHIDKYHRSDLIIDSIQSMKRLRYLSLRRNNRFSVPNVLKSLSSLKTLRLIDNDIAELGCLDFFNLERLEELDLSNNNIAKLDACVFQNQKELKVLNLSANVLFEFDDTFKIGLKKLEFLDLSDNQRRYGTGDLKSLESLSYLKLDGTPELNSMVFEGLNNLRSLCLSLTPINIDNHVNILGGPQWLTNLAVYLDGYKGVDPNYSQNSMNLSSLKNLDIICIGIHCSMPFHILKIMKNLEHFTAKNVHLVTFSDIDTFISTPQLKNLIMRQSGLSDINPKIFQPILKLEVLDLSINNLKSLDFLAQVNLTSLRSLILCENKLDVINDNIFHFLPALTYLDLSLNPLTCDCSNSGFLLWMLSSQTQIANLDRYVCTYPISKSGTMLLDIDVQSCWMDMSFLCYISTTSLVLLTLLTAFGNHFLRWRLVYAYYRLMALRYDMRERKRNKPYRYDAFISYNVQDEVWVHRELLPALEEERGWRLCLHHRDFQPGKAGWAGIFGLARA